MQEKLKKEKYYEVDVRRISIKDAEVGEIYMARVEGSLWLYPIPLQVKQKSQDISGDLIMFESGMEEYFDDSMVEIYTLPCLVWLEQRWAELLIEHAYSNDEKMTARICLASRNNFRKEEKDENSK